MASYTVSCNSGNLSFDATYYADSEDHAIELALEEIKDELERRARVYAENEECRECNGSGVCAVCDGRGFVDSDDSAVPDDCAVCGTTGLCEACDGSGEVEA